MNEGAHPEKLALFDYDGTLAAGDSIVPYLVFCMARGLAPAGQLFKAIRGWFGQLTNAQKAGPAKEKSLSFIKGHSQKEMDNAARDFFTHVVLPGYLYREGVNEINRLKKEGFRVLVVSASARVYMGVLGEYLPIDDVICTDCQLDGSGRYTGHLGANCRGAEKIRRIREYLAAKGIAADWENSTAYGDSFSDGPMLSLVGHPVLVNPKHKLRGLLPNAKQLRWKGTGTAAHR